MNYEYESILVRLRDIRQDLDITQNNIASLIGVKQGVYSRWESGKEMIPLFRLNKVCNLLHCTMDYIVGFSQSNKKSEVIYEIDLNVTSERLKIFRNSVGLTQKELAEVLNTTQSTISAYETGKTLILMAFAYQIAKDYGVSMDWLVGRSGEMYIKL